MEEIPRGINLVVHSINYCGHCSIWYGFVALVGKVWTICHQMYAVGDRASVIVVREVREVVGDANIIVHCDEWSPAGFSWQ
jgi:hypothetical protein